MSTVLSPPTLIAAALMPGSTACASDPTKEPSDWPTRNTRVGSSCTPRPVALMFWTSAMMSTALWRRQSRTAVGPGTRQPSPGISDPSGLKRHGAPWRRDDMVAFAIAENRLAQGTVSVTDQINGQRRESRLRER